MATEINNFDVVIDSRDVIARLEELEAIEAEELDTDELAECIALQQLVEEAQSSPDWQYGETLIRYSYFETYARELAEESGAMDEGIHIWPFTCIDWQEAARQLRIDYMEVDFDGITYLIRA